jgi:ribosomal protein L7Ae-like RNA K-turn-binding protein
VNSPWLQHLHFVMKANAYLTGELALRALSRKQVYYAIIATDTSLSHQKMLLERLTYYRIPHRIFLDKKTMNQLTKKDQVVMIAITNPQLAKTLKTKEIADEKQTTDSPREYPGEPRKN